ncbi:MAG: GxxExxY protein [Pseudomonadota bacterium]
MDKALTIARQVVASALALHGELGHRLTCEAYEAALAQDLEARGFAVEHCRALPILFEGELLDMGLVADLLVDSCVIVRLGSLVLVEAAQERLVLAQVAMEGPRVGVYLDFAGRRLDHLTVAAAEG